MRASSRTSGGPSGRAAQENERTTRQVVDQIRAVVEKIAGDKGLDIVLDAATGSIIYADRSLDLSADGGGAAQHASRARRSLKEAAPMVTRTLAELAERAEVVRSSVTARW